MFKMVVIQTWWRSSLDWFRGFTEVSNTSLVDCRYPELVVLAFLQTFHNELTVNNISIAAPRTIQSESININSWPAYDIAEDKELCSWLSHWSTVNAYHLTYAFNWKYENFPDLKVTVIWNHRVNWAASCKKWCLMYILTLTTQTSIFSHSLDWNL